MVLLRSLRYWRERRALTQEQLAQRAEVSRATIASIEKGNHQTFPTTVQKLARALRIEPEQLMDAIEGG